MRTSTLTALTLAALTTSCIIHVDANDGWADANGISSFRANRNQITGSGLEGQDHRMPDAFDRIQIEGSMDVDVEVGPALAVVLEGDDNLLSYVRTEVQDGNLLVRMKPGSYRTRHKLRVSITTPELRGVGLSGSGDVRVTGIAASKFRFDLSGSGDAVLQGATEDLRVRVSGSGDIQARGVDAHEVEVRIEGAGDVDVSASGDLYAEISGSGDVSYEGRPRTEFQVSGSGRVHHISQD